MRHLVILLLLFLFRKQILEFLGAAGEVLKMWGKKLFTRKYLKVFSTFTATGLIVSYVISFKAELFGMLPDDLFVFTFLLVEIVCIFYMLIISFWDVGLELESERERMMASEVQMRIEDMLPDYLRNQAINKEKLEE